MSDRNILLERVQGLHWRAYVQQLSEGCVEAKIIRSRESFPIMEAKALGDEIQRELNKRVILFNTTEYEGDYEVELKKKLTFHVTYFKKGDGFKIEIQGISPAHFQKKLSIADSNFECQAYDAALAGGGCGR
jgi:hypothetical protein